MGQKSATLRHTKILDELPLWGQSSRTFLQRQ
jgi:hypothetical protein